MILNKEDVIKIAKQNRLSWTLRAEVDQSNLVDFAAALFAIYSANASQSEQTHCQLSRNEIDECFDGLTSKGNGKSRYDIARAIETKLNEKTLNVRQNPINSTN